MPTRKINWNHGHDENIHPIRSACLDCPVFKQTYSKKENKIKKHEFVFRNIKFVVITDDVYKIAHILYNNDGYFSESFVSRIKRRFKHKKYGVDVPIEWPDNKIKIWCYKKCLHRVDGPAIEINNGGIRLWFLDGRLHRLDGPAIEFSDGTKEWYLKGQLHRIDGPAVENVDGTKNWYVNGLLHRLDGPAVEEPPIGYGDKKWYQNGILHRTNGPAIESWKRQEWYLNGMKHRTDGPAVEYKDFYSVKKDAIERRWYLNNILHRTDGPACENTDGSKMWYVNGKKHRLDGPAIDYSTHKVWCVNGKFHRIDGPAVMDYTNDTQELEGQRWYLYDKEIPKWLHHVCVFILKTFKIVK